MIGSVRDAGAASLRVLSAYLIASVVAALIIASALGDIYPAFLRNLADHSLARAVLVSVISFLATTMMVTQLVAIVALVPAAVSAAMLRLAGADHWALYAAAGVICAIIGRQFFPVPFGTPEHIELAAIAIAGFCAGFVYWSLAIRKAFSVSALALATALCVVAMVFLA